MYEIIVSGYGTGESATIVKYRFSNDWRTGEEVWSDNIESPSYLSIYKEMCFAITESENSGALYCYKKESDTYILKDKITLDVGALCYIHYSPRHKMLFGACYETGHVLAVSVNDHKFDAINSLFVIPPDKDKGITRAHCSMPDNDGNRLFVCNIALDRVYIYNIDNDRLIANDVLPYIQLEKGNGPRHIRFHPQFDIAYVITEYSNKIIVLSYDRVIGAFKTIQEVSVLPEDFAQQSYCSTLAFSPDGKYLYAANRGADTIGVFQINKEGLLEKIQDYNCCGNWPRHIEITADGRYLMAANQKSDNVAVISISEVNGRLEGNIKNIPFKAPGYVSEIKA